MRSRSVDEGSSSASCGGGDDAISTASFSSIDESGVLSSTNNVGRNVAVSGLR